MAVVPTPSTFSAVTSSVSDLNQMVDCLNFFLHPPMAELRATAAQSIPNNTWTALNLDTEDVDFDVSGTGGHSTSVNTSRYTAVYAGWYQLSGRCCWSINATNLRGTRWAVNGTALNSSATLENATASGSPSYPASVKLAFLNVGDYVELFVFQNSGGAINTATSGDQAPGMSIRWVSS